LHRTPYGRTYCEPAVLFASGSDPEGVFLLKLDVEGWEFGDPGYFSLFAKGPCQIASGVGVRKFQPSCRTKVSVRPISVGRWDRPEQQTPASGVGSALSSKCQIQGLVVSAPLAERLPQSTHRLALLSEAIFSIKRGKHIDQRIRVIRAPALRWLLFPGVDVVGESIVFSGLGDDDSDVCCCVVHLGAVQVSKTPQISPPRRFSGPLDVLNATLGTQQDARDPIGQTATVELPSSGPLRCLGNGHFSPERRRPQPSAPKAF